MFSLRIVSGSEESSTKYVRACVPSYDDIELPAYAFRIRLGDFF